MCTCKCPFTLRNAISANEGSFALSRSSSLQPWYFHRLNRDLSARLNRDKNPLLYIDNGQTCGLINNAIYEFSYIHEFSKGCLFLWKRLLPFLFPAGRLSFSSKTRNSMKNSPEIEKFNEKRMRWHHNFLCILNSVFGAKTLILQFSDVSMGWFECTNMAWMCPIFKKKCQNRHFRRNFWKMT